MMKSRNFRRVAVWSGIVVAWWCLSRTSPVESPASIIAIHPISIKRTLTVLPGTEGRMQLSFAASKTPGWLRGTWSVKDVSSMGKRSHDDSLVGFVMTAPNGKIIQNRDHPLSGNFAEHYTGGTYTLTFDNANWVRSSPRVVTFEGTYLPD
jgi:hypothetical protein